MHNASVKSSEAFHQHSRDFNKNSRLLRVGEGPGEKRTILNVLGFY